MKYDFSTPGIKAMYNDSLEDIFSALEDKNKDLTIGELHINISIGNRKIEIPIGADAFEILFDSIKKIHQLEEL